MGGRVVPRTASAIVPFAVLGRPLRRSLSPTSPVRLVAPDALAPLLQPDAAVDAPTCTHPQRCHSAGLNTFHLKSFSYN